VVLMRANDPQRYGLIGSNGSGKSTFLTSLASRELPIPDHIDIFHLDSEAEKSDRTALQAVIDVVQAQVERLEALAEHIRETAGPDADLVQDIYDRIDKLDPNTFQLRATEILMGLGFSHEFLKKKTEDLSGTRSLHRRPRSRRCAAAQSRGRADRARARRRWLAHACRARARAALAARDAPTGRADQPSRHGVVRLAREVPLQVPSDPHPRVALAGAPPCRPPAVALDSRLLHVPRREL